MVYTPLVTHLDVLFTFMEVSRNLTQNLYKGLLRQPIGYVKHKAEEKVKVKSLSCVQLFATPRTVARQTPLSMEFSRQEYWSGLPFPSPGDLPYPGIESGSPALQADS